MTVYSGFHQKQCYYEYPSHIVLTLHTIFKLKKRKTSSNFRLASEGDQVRVPWERPAFPLPCSPGPPSHHGGTHDPYMYSSLERTEMNGRRWVEWGTAFPPGVSRGQRPSHVRWGLTERSLHRHHDGATGSLATVRSWTCSPSLSGDVAMGLEVPPLCPPARSSWQPAPS